MNGMGNVIRAFIGWGIIANKFAGVIYPVVFVVYYQYLIRSDNGMISRTIAALPFILLLLVLAGYLITRKNALTTGQNAWNNGDTLDRIGGILLWVVLLGFFGILQTLGN